MSQYDHLLELAGRYADGGASALDVAELESALRTDPEFRAAFLNYMNVDATLGAASGNQPGVLFSSFQFKSSRKPFLYRVATLAAVAALILVVYLWSPWNRTQKPPILSTTQTAPAIVLTAATNARWSDANVELALRSGDVPADLLRLDAGMAEFRFANGASAVVLGPASIRFPSANQIFVEEGKVLCRCPTPQSRITLTTPSTQVVDLGTEFAVDVPAKSNATRVAVVSGSVRVGTSSPRILKTGESAEVGPDQAIRLTPLLPDALADLLAAASRNTSSGLGPNILNDPGFATDPINGVWRGSEGYVQPIAVPNVPPGQRAIAISAKGHRFWPGIRQSVPTGDISGRLVVASVDAISPPEDPTQERQSAILKLAFIDEHGREFANASRHFLQAQTGVNTPNTAHVAAVAPPGTVAIQFQLLLNARGLSSGTVLFQNPNLTITPSQPQ